MNPNNTMTGITQQQLDSFAKAYKNPVAMQNIAPVSNPTPSINTDLLNAQQGITNAATLDNTPGYSDRDKALAAYQGQIDALNTVAAQQKAKEALAGQSRLGQNAAIQARRGLLGSDFGAAATEGINVANTEEQNAIDARKQLELGGIYANINKFAQEIANARVEAAQKGASAKLAEIQGRETKINEAVKNTAQTILSKFKGDVSAITDQNITDWAKALKTTPQSVASIIAQAKKDYDSEAATKALELQKSTDIHQKNLSDISKTAAEIRKINSEIGDTANPLLSVTEANTLGVPYGTRRNEAINKPTTTNDVQKSISQIELAKRSIKNAKDLANASGNTSWFTGAARALAGARPIDNLTAETNNLRTTILTMGTDPAIKKFFGPQMSNADVQLMTAAGTTLNPELQSPVQMREELTRLESFINRAEAAVKAGQSQTTNTPAVTGQVNVKGIIYNVDANGDMTPA